MDVIYYSIFFTVFQLRGASRLNLARVYAKIIEGCRLSSVVEHFHGKEGVSSSNLEGGSIFYSKKKPQLAAGGL